MISLFKDGEFETLKEIGEYAEEVNHDEGLLSLIGVPWTACWPEWGKTHNVDEVTVDVIEALNVTDSVEVDELSEC
jgi:hypothetical protein